MFAIILYCIPLSLIVTAGLYTLDSARHTWRRPKHRKELA